MNPVAQSPGRPGWTAVAVLALALGLGANVASLSLALSLLTGVVFGVVPAWLLTRDDLAPTLRDCGRGSAGRAQPSRCGPIAHRSRLLVRNRGQVKLSAL